MIKGWETCFLQRSRLWQKLFSWNLLASFFKLLAIVYIAYSLAIRYVAVHTYWLRHAHLFCFWLWRLHAALTQLVFCARQIRHRLVCVPPVCVCVCVNVCVRKSRHINHRLCRKQGGRLRQRQRQSQWDRGWQAPKYIMLPVCLVWHTILGMVWHYGEELPQYNLE